MGEKTLGFLVLGLLRIFRRGGETAPPEEGWAKQVQ